jgi:hypothetical protein
LSNELRHHDFDTEFDDEFDARNKGSKCVG